MLAWKWSRTAVVFRASALIACSSVAYLLAAEPAQELPELLLAATPRDNAELVLINIGTGDELNLTRDPSFQGYPAWSPDGKKIAYAAAEATAMHICTIDPDGKNRRQLTNDAAWDRAPAFSPDGQKIVFGRIPAAGGVNSLYVMDAADGGKLRLLQTDGYDPAWSPDGKQIAFTSLRNGQAYRLFVMQADGSQVKELTTHDKKYGYVYPAWSPDGKKIAFTHVVGEYDLEIHIIDADGANLKQLTRLTGINTYAAWSPDGKRIAFRHHDRDRSPGPIYLIDADGAHPTILSVLADEPFLEGGRFAWKPATPAR
jgi:TolB protein